MAPADRGEAPFPTLFMTLGAAHRRYAGILRAALDAAGFGDLPAGGARVLGAIVHDLADVTAISERLGVTRQATGQLVDSLVDHGYCRRQGDVDDRRRTVLHLTDRGQDAAAAIGRISAGVEQALTDAVGARAVAGARAMLSALTDGDVDLPPSVGRRR